jgi:diguanylate cyclase (GGDEF)-like protein
MSRRLPVALGCTGANLLVLVIGYLDFATGPEIGFSLFYLVPVMLNSWHYYGSGVCTRSAPVLAATVWLLADLHGGYQYAGAWIPYWNMFTRLAIFLVISEALSRLRLANAHEQTLARTDALTGVFNSRYFRELARAEVSRLSRYREPFSFAYVDLDNFKTINDTLGHDQGDKLLQTLTRVIRTNIREIDIIARLGGDEFGILFPRTDSAQCRAAVDKIYAIFRREISTQWNVTLSAGVLTYHVPPKSWDQMVSAADELMYSAKREGKDKAAFGVVK